MSGRLLFCLRQGKAGGKVSVRYAEGGPFSSATLLERIFHLQSRVNANWRCCSGFAARKLEAFCVTREAFSTAHDISAYCYGSKRAAPLMTDGGSIIGMSYYGAEKVIKHYNVMGG